MRKIISFMHVSLDGFAAGPTGEMNWITVNEEIFNHVGKRISTTDTAFYGRNTYQLMESYWPEAGKSPTATKHEIEHSAWYRNAHKIILSTTLQPADLPAATIISTDLFKNVQAIKQSGDGEILLFGSPRATHSLMQENLLDGYWLFVNPIVLGQGIPLFKNIKNKTTLKLVKTHQFGCGVTELDYITATE